MMKKNRFTISEEMRLDMDEKTAQFILGYTQKHADCSFGQVNKSVDRAYTMFNIILTVFSGLTAFLFMYHDWYIIISCGILWCGLAKSLYLMLAKVVNVHRITYVGNMATNLIIEENMQVSKQQYPEQKGIWNDDYRIGLILDLIENNQRVSEQNMASIDEKVKVIQTVFKIIKITLILTVVSIALIFCIVGFYHCFQFFREHHQLFSF